MEVDRTLRAVRATVFAAACVGVSAAGHIWMSGGAIAAWALVVAVLAVGGAGYALAGRQRGFTSIAGLMLAGELGLHLLFTAAQNASSGMEPSTQWVPDMSRIIMAHPLPASAWLCGHGMNATGTSSGQGAMASMPWMSAFGSAGMIGVHVCAGLLCAWWLRRGEAATFRLLRSLAQFALPLLVIVWRGAAAIPDLTAHVADDLDDDAPTGRRLLVHAVIRRGPPAPVFSM
jgi:hypothetical protein